MAVNKTENEKLAPIIIKRVKKVAGGHHGGAWKVAYADFVTAMMAFFLLMWLLNVTTDEQKNAISNYFDPTHPRVSDTTSGAGGLLAGMSVSSQGAMVSSLQNISQAQVPQTSTRGSLHGADQPGNTEGLDADGGLYNMLDMTEEMLEAEFKRMEDERFEKAAEQLREDIAKAEELEGLNEHVLVDVTPEGLRIQIVDDQGRSMFPSGSALMHDFMRNLLLKVSSVIAPLPNQVSVRGHTDSVRYRDPTRYDNWNLSADRAQSSRRVLVEGGLQAPRIENVMGRADRDPLLLDDPSNERNRRISIVLLRERPALPDTPKAETQANQKQPQASAPAQPQAQSGAPTQAPSQGNARTQGLRIIDDTSAAPQPTQQNTAPQAQQPASATGGEAKNADDGANEASGEASSYVNKPPTIRTPVFNFGKKAEPDNLPPALPTTPSGQGAGAPEMPSLNAPVQDNRKSLIFP